MPNQASGVTLRHELAYAMEELPVAAAQKGFIAPLVLPPLRVPQQTAQLPVLPRDELLRLADLRRAPRAGYNRPAEYDVEDLTYICQEYGFEYPLDDSERSFFASWFAADRVAAERAQFKALLDWERRVAALLQDTAQFANTGVTTKWNDATAVPVTDVARAIRTFEEQTGGLPPNCLIISRRTQQDLSLVTQIINRLSTVVNKDAVLSAEQLAAALGIERVIVGKAMYNTKAPKIAPVYTRLWNPAYATLALVSAAADLQEPCVGRTCNWLEGESAGAEQGLIVEQYRDEPHRSDVFRARHSTDEKLISADFGYILTGVYAA